MTMEQFLVKYGYVTAGWMIRQAVQIGLAQEKPVFDEKVVKTLNELASDLDDALKSLEGKPL